jgi:hypothetical protein
MARIVVSGYMIRHPFAGNVLAFFHYILGLYRLGHDVVYLDESGWPNSCYDPEAHDYSDDPRAGLRFVRALLANYDAKIPVYYVNRDNGRVYGVDWDELKRMLGAADLLLNIGGVCWLPEFRSCRRRALIDMDPLFTQVGRFGAEGIHEYHAYFSYGGNIGRSGCTVPTDGIEWIPTVPPVVPEIWQGGESPRAEREKGDAQANVVLTTIANWSAYGAVTYRGEHYGQKNEEFLRLIDLPSRTSQTLELALSGASEEVMQQMRTAGWSIRNAGEVSVDMETYHAYITGSRGEFSAAKHAYVKTRSGWFSDRSVCYLAAGLPTILQDTGFSDWLSTGYGVVAFSSLEAAADCIEKVNREYAAHCQAATEITERIFSHRVVLPRLLDALL